MGNPSEFYLVNTLIPSSTAEDTPSQQAEGTYAINKTFAELQDMYRKHLLTGLKWIQEDGAAVIVPLLAVAEDLFTFRVAIDGKMETFTLNSSDELGHEEEPSGSGSVMKVVPLVNGKPDVTEPDPSIIYLTAGASESDPYTRWVWSDGMWANIGTTELNLDDCLLFVE